MILRPTPAAGCGMQNKRGLDSIRKERRGTFGYFQFAQLAHAMKPIKSPQPVEICTAPEQLATTGGYSVWGASFS